MEDMRRKLDMAEGSKSALQQQVGIEFIFEQCLQNV